MTMPAAKSKRAMVYFDPAVHKALRLKAVATERSLSDVVDEAVRAFLAEDADDVAAINERAAEPTVSFEACVQELRRDGAL